MIVKQVLSLLVLSVSFQLVKPSHTWYSFPSNASSAKLTTFESTLTWTRVETGNVYFATQFWFECGQGGYFGGQFHDDGTQHALFSIWDINATLKTAQGSSPWCHRFGGEGEGAQCPLKYPMEIGVDYTFKMVYDGRNASGEFWSASVTNEKSGIKTLIGQIILLDSVVGSYGMLKVGSVSFQEYYTGGDFYSGAAWTGPWFNGRSSTGYVAIDGDADCNEPSHVNDCLRDYCGPPVSFSEEGRGITKNCTKHMWTTNQRVNAADVISTPRDLPIYTKPTNI